MRRRCPGKGLGSMSEQAAAVHAQMVTEKNRVARNSVLVAVAITSLKFLVGVSTGSLGILSEALHSSLDLVAAVVTLFSVRVSDRPADAEHQYGHGKVENFSAFIEMALLLCTCVWIVWEAVQRLFFHAVDIAPSLWAVLVMAASIAMDSWRSRALRRVAKKYSSQALQADALHFATDIWSSAVVIAGLGFVWSGRHFGIAWLAKADPLSALGVAGIVMWVSSRLGHATLDALLDAAPSGVRNEIITQVARVTGVLAVERVRIRQAGSRYFADISVAMRRNLSFQSSDALAAEVRQRVIALLGDADVLVHAVPRVGLSENTFDRIRAAALRNDLSVHDVSVQDVDGAIHAELHVELEEHLTLREAHECVARLEADIHANAPEVASILSIIDSEPMVIEPQQALEANNALEERIRAAGAFFPEVVDVHEIACRRVGGQIYLSCHVTMPDELPLARVHQVQHALKIRIKRDLPYLQRVLIHPEPRTDNRR